MTLEQELDRLDSEIGQNLAEIARLSIGADGTERAGLEALRTRWQHLRQHVAFIRNNWRDAVHMRGRAH
jgi:hypothetical protein